MDNNWAKIWAVKRTPTDRGQVHVNTTSNLP